MRNQIYMSASTIQIPESTIHALDHLKAHPGESYVEVIERLITLCCDEEELTLRNGHGFKGLKKNIKVGMSTPLKR